MKRCVVLLVRNDKGEYLMGKRNDSGKITFPAGHLNDKELPRVGAARELMEETNLKHSGLFLKGVFMPKCGVLVYVYETSGVGSLTNENDPDKEFSRLWYGLPKDIKDTEWHIPPAHNCALKIIRA